MTMAGIVLAGGKSSRYGKPKMFETYNGKCFYEYSVDALKENSLSPIIISTNNKLTSFFKQSNEIMIIEDEQETYQGPLFALHNVLSKMKHVEWFFVLTCDVPFITPDFVKDLISYTKEGQFDAIVPIEAGKMQPLLALYHRRSLIQMENLLVKNQKSMRSLLDELNVCTVPYSTNQKLFTNINYKEDWLRYQEKE
jgi:molybdopterin-guanine dinucleotide biosynthesis protein A